MKGVVLALVTSYRICIICAINCITLPRVFVSSSEQLQFNRNVPAAPENLAVRFSSPRPIIIEKLKEPDNRSDLGGGDGPSLTSSSIFSVVSEEKLKLAIQLAKRDVKRRHLEEQVKQHVLGDAEGKSVLPQKPEQRLFGISERVEGRNALKPWTRLRQQQQLGQPSKMEITNSGAKVYVYTPNWNKLMPAVPDSPPTHDPGPGPKSNHKNNEDKSTQEVRRLQRELKSCIQKIEELAKKGERFIILSRIAIACCFAFPLSLGWDLNLWNVFNFFF